MVSLNGLVYSLNFNNSKPPTKRGLNEIKISLLSLGVKSCLTRHNFPRHNVFPPQKGYLGTLATSTHVCEIMDKISFKKITFLNIQHFLSKKSFF
jgi:hypothetical protein